MSSNLAERQRTGAGRDLVKTLWTAHVGPRSVQAEDDFVRRITTFYPISAEASRIRCNRMGGVGDYLRETMHLGALFAQLSGGLGIRSPH